jgi:hypothetical protein
MEDQRKLEVWELILRVLGNMRRLMNGGWKKEVRFRVRAIDSQLKVEIGRKRKEMMALGLEITSQIIRKSEKERGTRRLALKWRPGQ